MQCLKNGFICSLWRRFFVKKGLKSSTDSTVALLRPQACKDDDRRIRIFKTEFFCQHRVNTVLTLESDWQQAAHLPGRNSFLLIVLRFWSNVTTPDERITFFLQKSHIYPTTFLGTLHSNLHSTTLNTADKHIPHTHITYTHDTQNTCLYVFVR